MTTPASGPDITARPPGPRLAISIATLVIGVAVAAAGLGVTIVKVADEFQGPIHHAGDPAYTEHLDHGTFELFEGVTSSGVTTPLQGPRGITGLQVTGADGTPLPVDTNPANETLGRSGIEFQAIASFKTPAAGDYRIEVAGDAGEPFIIKSSFGDVARRAAGWLAMMGAGILIAITGVVMLITGIVRRRRAHRVAYATGYPAGYPAAAAPPVPSLPPAGWYPDPQQAGLNRYWDGARWTDQTHPR